MVSYAGTTDSTSNLAGVNAPGLAVGTRAGSDFDARTTVAAGSRLSSGMSSLVGSNDAALAKFRGGLGSQAVVQIDALTGTPRQVGRLDGLLTTPSSRPAADIALGYLRAHQDVFGLDTAEIAALNLRASYTDIAGITHLSFTQQVDGVEVYGNGVQVHVAKDGSIIAVSGSPVADLPGRVGKAKINAGQALRAAATDIGDPNGGVGSGGTGAGPAGLTSFADGSTAQQVLFATPAGVRLGWQTANVSDGYSHVIDAQSGRVLLRQNMRAEAAAPDAKADVWLNYPGAAKGGKATTVNLSQKGWLAKGSTTLNGAYAHVYSDVNDDVDVSNNAQPKADDEVTANAKTGFQAKLRPFTGDQRCTAAYPCSWDPAKPNSWQRNRAQNAAQMMFFISNYHDYLAKAPIGFTAKAGNFEAKGKDAVQVQILDGAATDKGLPDRNHADNANMMTWKDGQAPQMQMYLWGRLPRPGVPSDVAPRNSGDTADVVYHEYTHGLSNRLVRDASGNPALGTAQSGAMGEAWSDWYANTYLIDQKLTVENPKKADVVTGRYLFNGGDIRTEPMDCGLTPVKECPGNKFAGKGGYTYGDYGKVGVTTLRLPSGTVQVPSAEVHSDGEIWGQTLWDLRKALGGPLSLSLVTRGMSLSPANPSFLDMRDAIIQADRAVNKGKNAAKLWQVFANRGMGWFAAAIDGSDTSPVESFAVPPKAGTPTVDVTGNVIDADTLMPAVGVTVQIAAHASTVGGKYVAKTGADGKFVIKKVLAGTYPGVLVGGGGWFGNSQQAVVAPNMSPLVMAVRRDWAAKAGGATAVSLGQPDPGAAAGCGVEAMFDGSQSVGWSFPHLDAAKKAVPAVGIVTLPKPISISEIAVDPAATCGDKGSAGTAKYKIEVSADQQVWINAATGSFDSDNQGAMNKIKLDAKVGGIKVKFIKVSALSTVADETMVSVTDPQTGKPVDVPLCSTTEQPDLDRSGCEWIDMTEVAVYGS